MFAEDQRLVIRSDDLTWREAHDELIVLDMSSATYLTVNGSAKVLWDLLVDGATTHELTDALASRYRITDERARSDVKEFLASLEERSYVVVAP